HTICQDVMERPFDKLMALSQVEGHRNIARASRAAPQSMADQALFALCACPQFHSSQRWGREKGTVGFWV
ncbi:MAG: hypothetical protein JW932_17550, partial [Deltaproteobacteria bacterium]|nr:hypothetical protein [Deltaproteobacteria bacterium]